MVEDGDFAFLLMTYAITLLLYYRHFTNERMAAIAFHVAPPEVVCGVLQQKTVLVAAHVVRLTLVPSRVGHYSAISGVGPNESVLLIDVGAAGVKATLSHDAQR